jgi:hypothetical protein
MLAAQPEAVVGQERLWPASGWHSRSPPRSGMPVRSATCAMCQQRPTARAYADARPVFLCRLKRRSPACSPDGQCCEARPRSRRPNAALVDGCLRLTICNSATTRRANHHECIGPCRPHLQQTKLPAKWRNRRAGSGLGARFARASNATTRGSRTMSSVMGMMKPSALDGAPPS